MVRNSRGLLLESKLLPGVTASTHAAKRGRELVFQRNKWFIALTVGGDFSQSAIHHIDGDHRPPAIHGMAVGSKIPAAPAMRPGQHWIHGFTGRRNRGYAKAWNREQKNSYH